MSVVEEMGKAIWKAFHWVSQTNPIHLFMDITSSHRTEWVEMEYTDILKQNDNVEIKQ